MAESEPELLLFTARTLPLFRDGVAPLYPLPERFMERPCWVYRKGLLQADAIFEALPEESVDPVHHPHFWAMLCDVLGVVNHDDAFRRRILQAEGHGTVSIGYHTSASFAEVRSYFRQRLRVLAVDELVRERSEAQRASVEDTLRAVDQALKVTARSSATRGALHDYLHGGGTVPPVPRGSLPHLEGLFRRVTPRGFNEVHLRALDLLVAESSPLTAIERVVEMNDPVFDQHSIWRDLLRARGLTDDELEDSAVRVWSKADVLNSRSWWVLARAADDPGGFLQRWNASSLAVTVQRRLLFSAWVTWDLPRFRALAEALIAEHGRRFRDDALLHLLSARDPLPSVALLQRHLPEILAGRRPAARRRIEDALAQMAMP